MPSPLEVTHEDIASLDDYQLTDLLQRLLYLEATANDLPSSSVGVSLKIKVPDGGEDGRIRWEGGQDRTKWIPSRFTVFQCKAMEMNPAQCKAEILRSDKKGLKPRVEEVLDASGSYVLFYGRHCNATQRAKRLKAFREAVNSAKKPYYDTADIDIYDAERISQWTNVFVAASVWVLEVTGHGVPPGMHSWVEWNKYKDHRFNFAADHVAREHILLLRSHLRSQKKVARVVGLSGLGKTRLALEALRPPEPSDPVQQALNASVLYINAENCAESGARLPGEIVGWRQWKRQGLLVVDDCSLDLHEKLTQEIQHPDSKFSLLTLDYDLHRIQGPDPLIKLEPAPDEVIEAILRQAYGQLQETDVRRIVDFAQGFPQMAVLLAEARLNEFPNLGSLENDTLLRRIVWGHRAEDERVLAVISACSLFEHVGFNGEVTKQRDFLATEICHISGEDFYGIATRFLDRGLFELRGRFILVKPKPLAIRLAADWWRRCSPERAKELVDKATRIGLGEALCDQMAKLDFLPEAQSLVADLCGEQGPFGQAEVLNSEGGSRLFRSLSETNPDAATEALRRVFGTWPREKLLTVGPGRRNLVWTLEKLCFWERTFPVAARVMLQFAQAETENIANNATAQFVQLFQIRLPGTQAPFRLRLDLIEEALTSADPECRRVASMALGRALDGSHYHRMVGVELQGSGPAQRDWEPKTWAEVFDYWRACLSRLAQIAVGEDDAAFEARRQLARNIPGLVQYGLMNELDKSLSEVLRQVPYWPEALDAMKRVEKYALSKLPEQGRKQVAHWLHALRPKSLHDRLHAFVTAPIHDVERDANGRFVDKNEVEVQRLAVECAADLEPLLSELPNLLVGPQHNAYAFGAALGGAVQEPDLLIDAGFKALAILPDAAKPNPTLLSGILVAIREHNSDSVARHLDRIAADDSLRRHLIQITRAVGLGAKDCQRLLQQLKLGLIDVQAFSALAHARVPADAFEQVIGLARDLTDFGMAGAWAAFSILYGLSHDPEAGWSKLAGPLREVLMIEGLVESIGTSSLDHEYSIEESATRLLTERSDVPLAERFARGLIVACRTNELIFRHDLTLRPIVQLLLERYRDTVWPIVAEALLTKDAKTHSNLTFLLGLGASWRDDDNPGLLFILPSEVLLSWCETHSDRAPQVVARFMPILREEGGVTKVHSFAEAFLDRFGEREDVLREVAANLESFGSVGSRVPYYERRIAALRQLESHRLPGVKRWAGETASRFQRIQRREAEFDAERELL